MGVSLGSLRHVRARRVTRALTDLTCRGPAGEFWLGLEHIHALASQGRYLLQVELSDGRQQLDVATYRFQLAGEEQQFALRLEDESSTQENLLSPGASGLPFSTADRDNDSAAGVNCAQLLSGASTVFWRRLN